MADQATLRRARLAELGLEPYVLRQRKVPPASCQPAAIAAGTGARSEVLLLALAGGDAEARLLADLGLALARAGLVFRLAAPSEALPASARAVVVLGEAAARELGAGLPAARQQELSWVVGPALAGFGRDGACRRALWSELRQLARRLRDTG